MDTVRHIGPVQAEGSQRHTPQTEPNVKAVVNLPPTYKSQTETIIKLKAEIEILTAENNKLKGACEAGLEIEELKINFMFLKGQIEGFKSSEKENRDRWMDWIRAQRGNSDMWLAVNRAAAALSGGGKRRRKSLKRKPSLKKSKRKKTKRKKTKRKKTKRRRN